MTRKTSGRWVQLQSVTAAPGPISTRRRPDGGHGRDQTPPMTPTLSKCHPHPLLLFRGCRASRRRCRATDTTVRSLCDTSSQVATPGRKGPTPDRDAGGTCTPIPTLRRRTQSPAPTEQRQKNASWNDSSIRQASHRPPWVPAAGRSGSWPRRPSRCSPGRATLHPGPPPPCSPARCTTSPSPLGTICACTTAAAGSAPLSSIKRPHRRRNPPHRPSSPSWRRRHSPATAAPILAPL